MRSMMILMQMATVMAVNGFDAIIFVQNCSMNRPLAFRMPTMKPHVMTLSCEWIWVIHANYLSTLSLNQTFDRYDCSHDYLPEKQPRCRSFALDSSSVNLSRKKNIGLEDLHF